MFRFVFRVVSRFVSWVDASIIDVSGFACFICLQHSNISDTDCKFTLWHVCCMPFALIMRLILAASVVGVVGISFSSLIVLFIHRTFKINF
jgi:hypothetical protein